MWADKPKHQDEIIKRFNEGARNEVIAKEIGVSTRQVQRVLQRVLGPRPHGSGVSKFNQLDNLRAVVIALMRTQGRDFTKCELCGNDIPPGKFDIHHTKYEGATFADLVIVCRVCNLAPENTYLT